MKKSVLCVLILSLALSLTGCVREDKPAAETAMASVPAQTAAVEVKPREESIPNVTVFTSPEPSAALPAQEEIITAADALLTRYWACRGVDWDAFSTLYTNTPEDVVRADFENALSIDAYDSVVYTTVVSADPYYLVNATYYIVTGTHPNTHMSSDTYNIVFSRAGDVWSMDYSEAAIDAINESSNNDSRLYPKQYMDALMAGRNGCAFASYNYMYCDSKSVYQGCSNGEIKFACQDEEGNLLVWLWFANGTDANIYYTNADVTLTDDALGVIVDTSGSIGLPLKSMSSTLYLVTIPAEQVLTGTGQWGAVSSHLHFQSTP